MAVVTWNDHIEIVESGGETKAKVHEELTVLSWDELAAHDCSLYLQGSIAYNINEQKIAVWDGSDYWVDTDGETHAGGGSVEMKFYRRSSKGWSEILEGGTITVVQESSIVVGATDAPIVDDEPSLVDIEAESSDTEIATVETYDADYGCQAEVTGVDEGTAEITLTVISTGETFHFNVNVPGK